ncbi:MAG TPA: hypothetical protein VI895_07405 [Bdellovibrionota bacterium]|nr:hypothetical protein [Bdellovibrionota bacterium]
MTKTGIVQQLKTQPKDSAVMEALSELLQLLRESDNRVTERWARDLEPLIQSFQIAIHEAKNASAKTTSDFEIYTSIRERAEAAFREIEFQNRGLTLKVWVHSLLGALLVSVLVLSVSSVWDWQSTKEEQAAAVKWEVIRELDPTLAQRLEGIVENFLKKSAKR